MRDISWCTIIFFSGLNKDPRTRATYVLMAAVTFAGDIKIASPLTGDLYGLRGMKGEGSFVATVGEER